VCVRCHEAEGEKEKGAKRESKKSDRKEGESGDEMGQRAWLVRGAPPRHALLINQPSSRAPISLLCCPPIYRIRSHRHTYDRLARGI